MRLLFFIPSLRGGGAEKVTVRLAEKFAHHFEVTLVVIGSELDCQITVSPNINVIFLNKTRVITALPTIIRVLKDNRASHIISSMTHCNIAVLMAKYFAKGVSKAICIEHNDPRRQPKSAGALKSLIIKVLAGRIYRTASRVVCVSLGVRDAVLSHYRLDPNSVKLIYNPVLSEKRSLELSECRGDPPIVGTYILAVGRLVPAKNFALLIKAFSRTQAVRTHKLVLVGAGPCFDDLQALTIELGVNKSVIFTGYVQNVDPFYHNASLFVMSSDWEGLPTVIIEAMAFGVDIVSTDCDFGPREILLDGQLGALVNCGDAEELACAIDRRINENVDRIQLINRANQFTADIAFEKYMKELQI